jgi:hypothetical protein
MLFAVAAIFFNVLGQNVYDELRLTHSGANVVATVTKPTSDHGGCDYRYVISGRTYRGSADGCISSPAAGQAITVRYLPSHPSVSGQLSSSTPWAKIAINFLAPTLLAVAARFGVGRARSA